MTTEGKGNDLAKILRKELSWYNQMSTLVGRLNARLRDIIILLRRPRLYDLS